MSKARDIVRCDQTTDLSERQIARALGVSRTVVARTLQAFRHFFPLPPEPACSAALTTSSNSAA
jgi:hypothetical protein